MIIDTKKHTGPCVEEVNQRISVYNKLLPDLLSKLQSTLSGSKFVHGDIYKVFHEAIAWPASYGFIDVNTSCCTNKDGAKIQTCTPNVAPWEDRKIRVSLTHSTQVKACISYEPGVFSMDSSICSPMNLIQLMQA